MNPKFIMLDEPFAALDIERREEACALLKTLTKSRSLCVLVVTHDPLDAGRLGAQNIALSEPN